MCGILRLANAAAIGGVILTLAACGENPLEAAADAVRIVPDSTSFSLGTDGAAARVVVAVRNAGDETVYLARCGERLMLGVDRWTGNGWERVSGSVCLTSFAMAPLALEPGGADRDSTTITDTGRYRLRLDVSLDSGAPTGVMATSRAFDVLPAGNASTM